MKERYKNMMTEQTLSEEARQTFFGALERRACKRSRMPLRVAAIAVCACLMVPMTVFAADRIFDLGLVEIVTGNIEGYRTEYNGVGSRPIKDFSKSVRQIDGIEHRGYDSWEQAEEDIGFDLMDNAFFSQSETVPYLMFDYVKMFDAKWSGENTADRFHCYADYYGDAGQLYRASVTASYEREMTHITVTATVTAEHPAITAEEETVYHSAGKLYDPRYIKEITEETYTAASGLTAAIVRTEWNTLRAPDYEAVFAVNDISYRVNLGGYPLTGEERAREMLFEILENF